MNNKCPKQEMSLCGCQNAKGILSCYMIMQQEETNRTDVLNFNRKLKFNFQNKAKSQLGKKKP